MTPRKSGWAYGHDSIKSHRFTAGKAWSKCGDWRYPGDDKIASDVANNLKCAECKKGK